MLSAGQLQGAFTALNVMLVIALGVLATTNVSKMLCSSLMWNLIEHQAENGTERLARRCTSRCPGRAPSRFA
jgi:hypothetical protein